MWTVARALASKKLLEYTYNWGYHYYRLSDAGIQWIKGQFGITDKVVPVTHVKAVKPVVTNARAAPEEGAEEGEDDKPRTAARGGRGRGRGAPTY